MVGSNVLPSSVSFLLFSSRIHINSHTEPSLVKCNCKFPLAIQGVCNWFWLLCVCFYFLPWGEGKLMCALAHAHELAFAFAVKRTVSQVKQETWRRLFIPLPKFYIFQTFNLLFGENMLFVPSEMIWQLLLNHFSRWHTMSAVVDVYVSSS